MPRRPEPQPSAYACAVAREISRIQRERGLAIADIARGTPLSPNYLAERLRLEKSFTLTDIEVLGDFFGFDAATLLGAIGAAPASDGRRSVGAPRDHDRVAEPLAAGDDDTQAESEREAP